MASLAPEQFEKQKIQPAVARLGQVADEIAAGEDELEALVVAADYDDDAADVAELKVARLRREQARLERRVRNLGRRLSHVTGSGQKIEV